MVNSKGTNLSPLSRRLTLSIAGIAMNVILSFVMYRLGLPLFFDTLGTILVASVTGLFFPAILTAVTSNVICTFFYEPSMYMCIFNATIAIVTVTLAQKNALRKISSVVLYVAVLALISSLSSSLILSTLYRNDFPTLVVRNAQNFSASTSIPYFLAFFISNYLLYFIEKSFISILALIVLALVPQNFLNLFKNDIWNSRLVSPEAQKFISNNQTTSKYPLHKKIANLFVMTSIVLVVVTGYISLRVYFDNTIKDKRQNAWDCASTLAKSINPSQVDGFLKFRANAPGYTETQELFTKIQECSHNVSRLYAQKFEPNGSIYIFDTNREAFYQPGDLVPYDAHLAKEAESFIDGIYSRYYEHNSLFKWNYTYYYPVLDDSGKCVCYVCADATLNYFKEYMANFAMRVLLIMAGFFIVIISHTIWTIGNDISYPISAVASCIDRFSDVSSDQEKLEENVKIIRSLDIHSQDEIQTLYDAICRMMLSQSEQLSDIRSLSESTARMQDGLIITMADMVENRDSDTGEHVQKTAAYVKIIAEGLKKKGYYAQKITPKFISDAVRSAPLHDVGKINIPDNVLNKPGKLTDEEYAIMKTHTTAGKAILEKTLAILQEGSGTQFDPKCVEVFMDSLSEVKAVLKKYSGGSFVE